MNGSGLMSKLMRNAILGKLSVPHEGAMKPTTHIADTPGELMNGEGTASLKGSPSASLMRKLQGAGKF